MTEDRSPGVVFIKESVQCERRGGRPEEKKSLEEERHLKRSNDA